MKGISQRWKTPSVGFKTSCSSTPITKSETPLQGLLLQSKHCDEEDNLNEGRKDTAKGKDPPVNTAIPLLKQEEKQ